MTFRTQLLGILATKKYDRPRVTFSRVFKLVLWDTRFGRCVGVNDCVGGKVGIARWWWIAYGSAGAGYTMTVSGG